MSDWKTTWIAASAVLALVLAWLLLPRLREEFAPRPRLAWVAIEVGETGVAEVGRVDVASGTPFALHAVLEAEARDGSAVYYTDAPALHLFGSAVPARAVKPWDRPLTVRVLWFTVEGFRPFLRLETAADLEAFQFREFFRADWGSGWSVPGTVRPSNESFVLGSLEHGPFPFGTQRYHVRIELYERAGQIAPERYGSWGAADVLREPERFPTVVSSLPGPLALPSRAFGLTQIEPHLGVNGDVALRLRSWHGWDVAFSRVVLLDALVRERGLAWEDLVWTPIDFTTRPPWGGSGAGKGDLLRAGERVVVLFRDLGERGVLDYADLGIDYLEGTAVRPLGELFTGGGLIEWADLGEEAGA